MTNEQKDQTSAFPHHGGEPGITVRDYFAAKALQGIVGAAAFNQTAEDMLKNAGVPVPRFEAFIAMMCYNFADAMMVERKLEGTK